MKIIIEPGDMEEPEVIIRGRSGSEEVRQLLELLGGAGGISAVCGREGILFQAGGDQLFSHGRRKSQCISGIRSL